MDPIQTGGFGAKVSIEATTRENMHNETITAKRLHDLVVRQKFRCPLTGRELTPQSASLDHVIPLSVGGANDMSNVQIVDYQANQAKGIMSNEEFIELCVEVAKCRRASLSGAAAG